MPQCFALGAADAADTHTMATSAAAAAPARHRKAECVMPIPNSQTAANCLRKLNHET
jgi:hypothetical protein